MGKIALLDKSIYNRLSAGEVVENPASIVKELVENSVDAGAQQITVMISGGGIKSIDVIDDGCGIEKDDLDKAILPHATSKITCVEDLNTISTLGFRGEALASIAAVSQVEIKSKFLTDDTANFIKVKAGEIIEKGTCGLSKGTTINVSSLFFNTPARFKFLKPVKTEATTVTKLMQELMVANPEVGFKYYIDGKGIYHTNGSGIENVLLTIVGQEVCDNLLPIEISEKNYIIKGFVGRPTSEAIVGNKNKQIFTVNGRIFNDATLSAVIQNAYGDTLMKRTFPVVVIDIVMPFDDVDVNVHPGKKEVRFAEQKILNGMIYKVVKDAINNDEKERQEELQKSMNLSSETKLEIYKQLKHAVELKEIEEANFSEPSDSLMKLKELTEKYNVDVVEEKSHKYMRKPWPCVEEDEHPDPSIAYLDGLPPQRIAQIVNDPYRIDVDFSDRFIPKYIDENEAIQEEETLSGIIPDIKVRAMYDESKNKIHPDYRIVGQIFDTYLIIETNDKIYIIDQHAAHERVLYNQLIDGSKNQIAIQDLFIPYKVDMEDEEFDLFSRHINSLKKLGFGVVAKANSVEINSVPCILMNMEINQFVYSVIHSSGEISKLKDLSEIKSKFAQMACRSAIKGGEKLNNAQIKYFMNYLFDNNMPLQCPHGRPTVVIYDRNDVEKWFKRKI